MNEDQAKESAVGNLISRLSGEVKAQGDAIKKLRSRLTPVLQTTPIAAETAEKTPSPCALVEQLDALSNGIKKNTAEIQIMLKELQL